MFNLIRNYDYMYQNIRYYSPLSVTFVWTLLSGTTGRSGPILKHRYDALLINSVLERDLWIIARRSKSNFDYDILLRHAKIAQTPKSDGKSVTSFDITKNASKDEIWYFSGPQDIHDNYGENSNDVREKISFAESTLFETRHFSLSI